MLQWSASYSITLITTIFNFLLQSTNKNHAYIMQSITYNKLVANPKMICQSMHILRQTMPRTNMNSVSLILLDSSHAYVIGFLNTVLGKSFFGPDKTRH